MEAMRKLGAVLVRTKPVLRGMKLSEASGDRLYLQLRVAGHTRWEIQRDARKLLILLIRRAYILPTNVELDLVATERNGRELYAGEGRTPMTKTARPATKNDGRPWDDYEWWGDELPTADADPHGSAGTPHHPATMGEAAGGDSRLPLHPPASASPVPEVWADAPE